MKKDPFTPSKKTIRKPDHTKVTTKLDNNVRKSIAMAQTGAELLPEFERFSYDVDWSNFPSSLMISCHLHPEHCPEDTTEIEVQLSKLLKLGLLKQGIKFKDFRRNVKLVYESKILS